MVKLRASALGFWRARANELAEAEVALHARMCPEIEKVMGSKRLLLFDAMLK